MRTGMIGLGFTALLLAGCHRGPSMAPDTQSFTRNVNATLSQVVEATTAVFADRRIPVSSTDQTNGTVQSVPLSLDADWGNVSVDERVDCRAVTVPDPNARLVLKMQVKRDDNRSAFSLEATRDGGESCLLRGPFLTGLMDEIVARAGG